MGGGSSDAAAVLWGLNKLYCTSINYDTMIKLASKVHSIEEFESAIKYENGKKFHNKK